MTRLLAVVRNLGRDEEGASMAEYGLLLALIAVVCLAAVALVGTNASIMFSTVAASV